MEPETSEWAAVVNRLDRLEKQNRRMKQIGGFVLVLAASVLLMGQAAPKKTVEANEFILKDSSGRERGRFDMGSFGDEPQLSLFAVKGPSVKLSALDNEGGSLRLFDSNNKTRLTLDAIGFGPELMLLDSDGKTPQATLSFSIETTATESFPLTDEAGNTVPYHPQIGGPSLTLGRRPQAVSFLNQDGLLMLHTEPFHIAGLQHDGLWLRGAAGTLALNSDNGNLTVKDTEGFESVIGTQELVTPRTGETHKTSAASVILFGKDKNVLWKAP